MSAAEKAAADAVFGDNAPEELTAEAVQTADAFNRGAIPEVETPTAKKAGGDVAAEPGSEPETPETDKGKTQAEIDAEAEAEAAKTGKTEEELAAEAEAAKGEKTPEELAAEEAAAKEEEKDAIRVRLRRDSFENETDWKVAQKAMEFIRAGMSPAKAEAAAKETLGIKTEPAAKVEAPVLPEAETLKAAESSLEAKEAERDAALLAFDNEKVVALNKEIKALTKQVTDAERNLEKAQASHASYEQSIARAIEEFPDSATEGHILYDAIAGRFSRMKPEDPLWSNPDRAMIVAKEQAARLGIKGKSDKTPAATPPPVTPAKPTAQKPQKVSPVPGAARTTIPSQTPEQAVDAELSKTLGKNAHMLAGIS